MFAFHFMLKIQQKLHITGCGFITESLSLPLKLGDAIAKDKEMITIVN